MHVCFSHVLVIVWLMNSIFNIIVIPVGFMFPCDYISPVSHNVLRISCIHTKQVVVLYPALFLDILVFLLRDCWGCHLILFKSDVYLKFRK